MISNEMNICSTTFKFLIDKRIVRLADLKLICEPTCSYREW